MRAREGRLQGRGAVRGESGCPDTGRPPPSLSFRVPMSLSPSGAIKAKPSEQWTSRTPERPVSPLSPFTALRDSDLSSAALTPADSQPPAPWVGSALGSRGPTSGHPRMAL